MKTESLKLKAQGYLNGVCDPERMREMEGKRDGLDVYDAGDQGGHADGQDGGWV
jgi:hypothetical protein